MESQKTQSNYKSPPNLSDSIEYELWKKEVLLWKTCCKLEKKEQGPALALSLKGKARTAALELEVDTLNADDGVDKLVAKLDGLYLKDENQRKYISMKAYEQYTRDSTQSIDSYINDFERLLNKVKSYKIELPDFAIAYRFLENANLEPSKADLVRSTLSEVTYKEVKIQLRKLDDVAFSSGSSFDTSAIKSEPEDVLFSSSRARGRFIRGRQMGSRRVGGRRVRFHSHRGVGRGRGYRRGACFCCGSTEHYMYDCPRYNDGDNNGDGDNNSVPEGDGVDEVMLQI